MKTKIKLLMAATALVITFTQCSKDYLDMEPQSELAISNAYNTAADAESALVGVYSCLADGHQNWLRMCLVDNFDDNVYAGGDDPSLFRIRAFQLTASNDDYIIDLWAACYNMINCANNVLKYVPEINDPKLDIKVDGQLTRRDQILGEATYLRAMKYFDLVRMFDGVPMPLTPTVSTDAQSVNLVRTPGDQVYAQLIKDLEYCLTVLPDSYSDETQTRGRATKGAANAMLAQIYATQVPADWAKVDKYCTDVISNSAVYSLHPSYEELFDGFHYNNTESIIEIQFQSPNVTAWQYHLLLPTSITGDNWRKFMTPTLDLVTKLRSAGDSVRLHSSIVFEQSDWTDEYWGNNVPFVFKWKHDEGWASEDHWYIQRLSETILLRAEAKAELGDTPGALADLKSVRDRVSLPDLTNELSTASKDEVQDAILNERRFELAFEGFRWMDLKRTGKAVSTLTNLGYTLDEHLLLLPIPLTERNVNPSLTQNPGY
ncbi:MAG: RagB/SusD family nutrient uptake outer membrane protein [Lentimicrobium sp.]|jgi:hypothetical protein|nr:RagB/SusD family nutrient uptake outer membrane protein [Lentimicrobium sp.]